MKSKLIKVSLLHGSGSLNPEYREFFAEIDNLKLVQEARDPETFLAQHRDEHPDLVLVDLNGSGAIPGWLDPLVEELPQTEVMVCSHSRDPDFLIRVMKLRVGGFIPLPLDREDFLTTLERIRHERARRHVPSHGQIMAVTGTKGGVGVTSVATNLAVALAESMPGEVLLIDLARPFPQVGQFLDLRSSYSIKDLENVHNLDHIYLKKIVQEHKSKLGVLLGSPDYTLNSPKVYDRKTIGQILRMLCNSYRWVVVDLGVWLDPFYARVLQEADQILLVTELSVPNLQNLKVLKSFFRGYDLNLDKVKMLANRYEKNYALGLGNLEEIMGRPVFQTLPHEPEILKEAINQGEPLSDEAPRSKLWRQFKELAAELAAQNKSDSDAPDGAKAGLLWRLFSSKGGNGNGMAIGR